MLISRKFTSVCLLVLVLISNVLLAQNGKTKIHKLAKGETLYALSKKYKVSLEDIKKANPGMGDDLDIGQEIKIPLAGKTNSKEEAKDEKEDFKGEFFVHKLKSGETLSALSKKYKVGLDKIKKANPGLSDKLDVGDEIKIPGKQKVVAAKPIKEKEQPQEEENFAEPQGDIIKHKLKANENFKVLSKKYGVSVAEILKVNPKLGAKVKVGTIVNIPASKDKMATEEVAKEPVAQQEPAENESITEQVTTSQNNLTHKVAKKETLFTIAKKYKTTVAKLQKLNPSAKKGLKEGQILVISTKNTSVAKPAEEVKEPAQAIVNEEPTEAGFHIVKSKQTQFSIAKQYKISVNELRKWNKLSAKSQLKVGQKLVVAKPTIEPNEPITETSTAQVVEKTKETGTLNMVENQEVDEPSSPQNAAKTLVIKPETKEVPIDPDKITVTSTTAVNASGYDKIVEAGLAEVMGENVESNKFLALHKTAPIGTLIQVKNPMTEIAIFVRVIGKLPESSSNDKIIIKVSKKVRERIGALNQRFPVEISYIP